MWPHRTLIAASVPAPAHSDFAVCSMNPWTAIHAMVNRETDTGGDLARAEAVTVAEAIRADTALGAWSGREEGTKGSLAIGKLADLAVLDRDPFAIDPRGLKDVQTLMTRVVGDLRFTVWASRRPAAALQRIAIPGRAAGLAQDIGARQPIADALGRRISASFRAEAASEEVVAPAV
jgi:hypothetical protein